MGKLKTRLSSAFLLIIYIFVDLLYSEFNMSREKVYSLVTNFDTNTPFIKLFVIPYYFWYTFMAIGLVLLLFKNNKEYMRSMVVLSIGQLICYFIYFNFQTTVPRPILYGDDPLTKMIALMYKIDQPFNCFPSIHVFTTFSITIALLRTKELSKKIKSSAIIISILIILSTIFIKQHVILDVFGGLILSIMVYRTIIVLEEVVFKVLKKRVSLS